MDSPVILPKYYCGISGLVVPVPKYQFPEEFRNFSRLQYYATFYNSIEINSSFYKIPRGATLARWAASVPDKFRFTYKLFENITHVKPFVVNEKDTLLFLEALSGAEDKIGCLLIQFPPSLKVHSIDAVDKLLEFIRKSSQNKTIPIAVEFRDKSWYQDGVYRMLDVHHATIVIHDKASVPSPMLNLPTPLIYLRFHGPSGDYRGSYSDDFLYEYAGYIHEWLKEDKTVYVYFNNTMGDAFTNLQTLNRFLTELK